MVGVSPRDCGGRMSISWSIQVCVGAFEGVGVEKRLSSGM